MSRRNREKRAAKQKIRRRVAAERASTSAWDGLFGPGLFGSGPSGAGPTGAGPDRAVVQRIIATALHAAATCDCGELRQHAADLAADFGSSGPDLDIAAGLAVEESVRAAWDGGWMPADLHELARRRLVEPAVGYLDEAIVIESRRYAVAMVHPRWRVSLAAVVAGTDLLTDVPHLRQWATGHAASRATALAVAMEVLALLDELPVLERLLPLPGESRHAVGPAGEVDERVLAKVRGLLAKAESTEFPEEAETLSAKAQELMSRYSLHQAVADHDRGRVPQAVGRRLWMEAPYAGPKALLVQSVATANRCRAVWSENLGFVTVVGPETELDMVELLTTSLLVQAGRAMLAAGTHVTRAGTSRTRSFRQSFLVAYATRIGERLDTASAGVTAEIAAEAEVSGRLLPVLAARSRATEELTDRLFPTMTRRSLAATNAAGVRAGRAAADLALFDVHGSIAG